MDSDTLESRLIALRKRAPRYDDSELNDAIEEAECSLEDLGESIKLAEIRLSELDDEDEDSDPPEDDDDSVEADAE